MEKREEIENPESCLNRAADDEPVFVLRAKDPLFGHVVGYWAWLAEQNRVHEPEKIAGAREDAQEGDDWRLRNVLERQRQPPTPEAPVNVYDKQAGGRAGYIHPAAPRDCQSHVDRTHRFTIREEKRDDIRCRCGAWQSEIVEAARREGS